MQFLSILTFSNQITILCMLYDKSHNDNLIVINKLITISLYYVSYMTKVIMTLWVLSYRIHNTVIWLENVKIDKNALTRSFYFTIIQVGKVSRQISQWVENYFSDLSGKVSWKSLKWVGFLKLESLPCLVDTNVLAELEEIEIEFWMYKYKRYDCTICLVTLADL